MTTQEAIKQLEQVAHICTTTALAEAALMGARALDQNDSWILCTERLPEREGEYLISERAGMFKSVMIAKFIPRGNKWLPTDGRYTRNVRAWRELPEPVREG